jgi:hypothetical protein
VWNECQFCFFFIFNGHTIQSLTILCSFVKDSCQVKFWIFVDSRAVAVHPVRKRRVTISVNSFGSVNWIWSWVCNAANPRHPFVLDNACFLGPKLNREGACMLQLDRFLQRQMQFHFCILQLVLFIRRRLGQAQ